LILVAARLRAVFTPDLIQACDEKFTILSVADYADRRSEYFDVVFGQDSVFLKREAKVERCWPPMKGESRRVFLSRLLARKFLCKRQKVNPVGQRFVCLHCRNIRVHQYDLNTFFLSALIACDPE